MRAAIGALVVCAATAATANTSHHHVGGGGGGEAECIRWEPIPVDMAGRDMTVVDMATADGGVAGTETTSLTVDAGAARDMATSSASHAGMRCAERASLFSCSYAHGGADGGWGAVALLSVFALTLGRARRRARG